MTISKEIRNDVFEALDSREAPTLFMHGCNMQGAMGAGVAKIVKKKWPYVYQTYKNFCAGQDVTLGGVVIAPHDPKPDDGKPPVYVANALTQEHWNRKAAGAKPGEPMANVEAIKVALAGIERTLGDRADRWEFVAVRVGSGLGGLDWETEVKPLYEASGLTWTVYYL